MVTRKRAGLIILAAFVPGIISATWFTLKVRAGGFSATYCKYEVSAAESLNCKDHEFHVKTKDGHYYYCDSCIGSCDGLTQESQNLNCTLLNRASSNCVECP